MPKFNVKRRMPYSAKQLYDIAADVASYKEFIPLVRKIAIANRKTSAEGVETFDAEMTVMYKKLGIEEKTLSHVTASPKDLTVTARADQGAVKSLDTQWRVHLIDDKSCDVEFSVDYTLRSRSLQFLLSGMFDMMVRRVMTAFEDRAKKLYGSVSA